MITPTLFSLAGLTSVVLAKDLMGYSDLIINRGLGANAVGQIAFFQIVPLLTLIFPLAVMMGVLVAMGRLGADLEIMSLEALGVRATRLAGPIGLFSFVMALICLGLSLVVAPWASRSLDEALVALSQKNPAAQIRAGVIQRFGDWQLEAREVSARGDEMSNVLLWLPSLSDTIFARSAALVANPHAGIDMQLTGGRILLSAKNGPRHVEFDQLSTTLPGSERAAERDMNDQLKGKTLSQLWQTAVRDAETPDEYPAAAVEAHRRFANPLTTLLFGLIAIPLFLTRKEYSRSAGGLLGLTTIVGYFSVVQLSDGLIQKHVLSPAQGVWLPDVIIALIGAWLFSSIATKGVFGRELDRQRAGGQNPASERRYRGPKRWALQRYIVGRFLAFWLLAFGILTAAYLLVDILERLQWFAKYDATAIEILRFYGARMPVLASRVVPMSLLVGTSLTASHLAVQGELMGLRSCGIPAPRALMPVLVICTLVAPIYFIVNNEVIPISAARQDEIKREEIKPGAHSKNQEAPAWYRVKTKLYQVGIMDADLGQAEAITVYELGQDGLPQSRTDATSARHIGKGNWRLTDAQRFELRDDAFQIVTPPPFARLGTEIRASVDTKHLSIAELRDEIDDVEKNGLDATVLWVDLHVKLSAPYACIVLPAIVLFFAVGGPPFPSSATTLLVSGVLAIGYVLMTGTGASLGYGGAVAPMAAGWGPIVLLAGIAVHSGLRLRARGQPLSGRGTS